MFSSQYRFAILFLFLCKVHSILHEWGPTDKLRLRDGGDPNDFFGTAVDVAGNTLAASAIGDTDRGTDAGAVYIYTKGSRRKWSLQQKLVPDDGVLENYVNDGFGTSVSLLPDLLAVGSPRRGVTIGDNLGAVYIFRRSNGVWVQEQIIVGAETVHNDLFGFAVKFIDESTLVVGSPVFTGLNKAGSIYTFEADINGQFQQTSRVEGSEAKGNDYFGFSLDSDEGRVIVGAPGDEGKGSAYIFDIVAGALVENTRVEPEFGLEGDEFGYSVAIGPTMAAVGSRSDDDNFIGNGAGSVFVYELDETATSWEYFQKITRTNPLSRITGRAATGLLGESLAFDGGYLVVGAPGWDGVAFVNGGRIYVYKKRSRSGKWRTADIVTSCGEIPEEDNFGTTVALDMTTGTLITGSIEGGRRTEDGSPGTVIIFERRAVGILPLQKARCWLNL
ncbi:hypothetical protein FisN_6Lh205 [Fistulifera solaris]|uniref:Uncharacterized protein n=1 Tax=Fistulifera solaris TaxID=1519565 RepID=A0A1Z5J613_FISSO|nr:hypothetical protein FisN_6Lh205 [Fistulifera solaris]|eukprot:GAX09420.1 hypothetical protein FisN_6Lh205 [Fistulifera solaris]